MAWTDAARAASLAVRQAKARGRVTISGKKVTPMRWYHGTPTPIKGARLHAPNPWTGRKREVWATSSIYDARLYAGAKRTFRNPGHGTLYGVNVRGPHRYFAKFSLPRYQMRKDLSRQKINVVNVSGRRGVEPRAYRLPRAHGRAARGRY